MLSLRRAVLFNCLRSFSSGSPRNMPIKVGDAVPSVEVCENTPGGKVNVAELFKGKTGVLFAVPGAFTPGCSKTHLPGYVGDFDKLTAKGAEVIACVSVNDPFVMAAWGEAHKAEGKVRMLADLHGEFTKAVDMVLDATPFLGNQRSKRYSLVIKDGKVTAVNEEPDGTGLTCSLADTVLNQL
ncbi:peroxiredoxin-5, mitochondrial-like isoform X1 [Lytechinus variegatus]|uniref:peroxiredoxin-5, mitochondrial-like isoform X1 n=1 Tax=Lytechinus variegatus TaxID=7654 RepID=UPI001BB1A759|nr:peroxiredoxin-5, mitochondrial-like isoform X1 [Lytechinus variegatus]